jgi:CelD/BcsL family acetyltransferase involved in cellulose biosynthesis
MDFREYDSAQEFLRNQLGKKVYKNLRQDNQRLERNHTTRFEFFFGAIDESKCEILLETLKGFISVRFKGKTSKHAALNRWGFYQDTVYEMILAKKASLFVIYELELPIAISLHYHYKKILYAAIISFDTRFSKYSMGRQMFVQQIIWCYDNNYQLLDMGWGAYDYKLKFSNAVYRHQTHVLYPKKSIGKKLVAYCISWALMFKYYGARLRDREFKIPESKFKNRWLKHLDVN